MMSALWHDLSRNNQGSGSLACMRSKITTERCPAAAAAACWRRIDEEGVHATMAASKKFGGRTYEKTTDVHNAWDKHMQAWRTRYDVCAFEHDYAIDAYGYAASAIPPPDNHNKTTIKAKACN